MLKNIITLTGLALLLSACATSIPTTTKMSDAIMMGIKTSTTKAIGYEYQSHIQDGVIKPCNKDTRDVQSSHPGYIHTESSTLDKI